jgi:hypothetical protein
LRDSHVENQRYTWMPQTGSGAGVESSAMSFSTPVCASGLATAAEVKEAALRPEPDRGFAVMT